ncbi:PspC domain-containing protein [Paenibacillus eucommiae]|uniref:Phage shock protein PspC (Stress-responsive transcriptional regulator) n=1 Tax=Paenibacillus eucommiae TaxID=1355755 RepID=A0ABS4IXT4_9BACL|nr:PspC domain-containing protein [Paenibacillus eucommiae]MBP1992373.1 phage shock protein PspC (stress-responsive transcriptional regulator) [Paenibacillus eucommiae]
MSKLYRSRRDKKVTGLCGGLAETLNVDATLLRLVVVVTAFFSAGTVILLYFVASMVIPKEPGFYPPHHDPYAGPYGNPNPNFNSGGWDNNRAYSDRGPSSAAGFNRGPAGGAASSASYEGSKSSNIDELMKDIEKKALQKELEELRAKVAQLEKNNENNNKGDV